MRLPACADGRGVEIGPSDIMAWRDCPARAKLGRRRLEGSEAPETWSPENAYGDAVHYVIMRLDEGDDVQDAVQRAFERRRQWLEPSDLTRLTEDADKYLAREQLGVRTLLNEGNISIPLFEHPQQGQVWLRGRIDRLYQSLDDPGLLIQRDWKSSKWPRSHEQVGGDLVLWSYNLLICEWFADFYPEVEHVRLIQIYDQLRYGEIPTHKSAEQREEIRRWLIAAVTGMINDEQEAPTFNQFCAWCPLKMTCTVVRDELTDWALTEIAALMPRSERHNKDGSVSKRPGPVALDGDRIAEYVQLLPRVQQAGQVLERFGEQLREVLKRMPDSELARLGRRKSDRSRSVFSVEAKRNIVERVGLSVALMLFDLSLASVERFFGADSQEAKEIIALAQKEHAYAAIVNL
jgi:PD-(D/E)XK nuclease superfamily